MRVHEEKRQVLREEWFSGIRCDVCQSKEVAHKDLPCGGWVQLNPSDHFSAVCADCVREAFRKTHPELFT